MNKYSESLIELMAEAMENEFRLPSIQFGGISKVIYDGYLSESYVNSQIEVVLMNTGKYDIPYIEFKTQCWWLHCGFLVCLTDAQIEEFKQKYSYES